MADQTDTTGLLERHRREDSPAGREEIAREVIDRACCRLQYLARKMLARGNYQFPDGAEYVDPAVNEAVIRLMRHMKEHTFQSTAHFLGIAGLEIQRALQNLDRARKRRYGPPDRVPRDEPPEPWELMARRECPELIDRLPERHQEVVRLRWLVGLKAGEVARALNISERMERALFKEAKEKLFTYCPTRHANSQEERDT